MRRKTLKRLLVAIVAVLSLCSMAEAAGAKRVARHRAPHSTRVAPGRATTKKKSVQRRRHRANPTSRTHKLPPKPKATTAPR